MWENMLQSTGLRNGHLSFTCSGVMFPPLRSQYCGVSGSEQDKRECVTDLSMHTETDMAGLWVAKDQRPRRMTAVETRLARQG
jgi:hypothetical protein